MQTVINAIERFIGDEAGLKVYGSVACGESMGNGTDTAGISAPHKGCHGS